jgi:hypothetical protein
MEPYNIVLVVVLHLLDARVDERLKSITLSLYDEFLLAILELRSWQQHVFEEAKHAVAFDHLRSSLGLADLSADGVFGIKKINL